MPRQPITVCIHRWKLGEPSIEGTPGTCRHCGRSKFFPSGLLLEPEVAEASGKAEKDARQAAAEWFSLN